MAKARPVDLDPQMTFAQAAAVTVATRSHELFVCADRVLDTDDIERVHDMRVASRRLRAALEVFAPCFPRKEHQDLLREVKQLADALGERRDPDVQIAALSSCGRLPAEDHPGVDLLIDRARAAAGRREHGAARGARGRAHPRPARAPGGAGAAVKARKVKHLDPAGSLEDNARRIIAVRAQEVLDLAATRRTRSHVKALHDLRIAAKRLRYLLELTGPPSTGQAAQAPAGPARRHPRLRRPAAAGAGARARGGGAGGPRPADAAIHFATRRAELFERFYQGWPELEQTFTPLSHAADGGPVEVPS